MKIYPFFRAFLFRLDPESAHQFTLRLMQLAGNIQPVSGMLQRFYYIPQRPVNAFGLRFRNPIGLAAGYDKDGLSWRGLACLGFSHVEIGTVTPLAQPGNPKPRIFRLPDEKAIINRMGFPGKGAEFVKKRIGGTRPKDFVLGLNIGKNSDTPLEAATLDYLKLMDIFSQYADYLTINISSPNTIVLRRLQEGRALSNLLRSVNLERNRLEQLISARPPVLIKLAPDLTDGELDEALDAIQANQMDGVIATNTTISRDGLKSRLRNENGGLSGMPLASRSLAMVKKINQRSGGKLPVIGVGGIFNATDVQKLMDAGAVLVQVYTGLIYEGPGILKRIMHDL